MEPVFIKSLLYYNCERKEVEFQNRDAADSINSWVSRATGGKICSIIEGPLPERTAAILLNATYFKGSWKRPFDSANTRQSTFHLASGRETKCQMMWLSREDHAEMMPGQYVRFDPHISCYYPAIPGAPHQGNGLRKTAGVTLPYGNGSFRMTILVPLRHYYDSSATIDTLMKQFTWKTWRSTLSLFKQDEFDLGLPKFRIHYGRDLKETLQTLGITKAFDPQQADFSNMFADGRGWIDRVRQETFVQVDESGTEAAAVTALRWPQSIPPTIVADRPFLVVIYEADSGAILFIGKIANPSWDGNR